MARINVEDSIYRDPRFVQLCAKVGSMEEALGTMVLVWDAAQRAFWSHPPESATNVVVSASDLRSRLKHFEAVVSAGLVRLITTEEAYVCGSNEAFADLREKRLKNSESGRIGGKKSAQVRVNKNERSETKRTLANVSECKRNEAKRTSSTSTSTSIIPFPTETGVSSPKADDSRNPVSLWVKAYAERYRVRYAFQKKDFGMLKSAGDVHGPDRLEVLFACYLAISEPLYANAKHPLSLFFRDLQKISVAAHTGIDPSKPEKFDVSKLKD